MRGALALLLACAPEGIDPRVRDDVKAVAEANAGEVEAAQERAAAHGRAAIPEIETALQNAGVEGRLNLIGALRRIGDGEAIPLLLHRALHDDDERVRTEAEWTLKQLRKK